MFALLSKPKGQNAAGRALERRMRSGTGLRPGWGPDPSTGDACPSVFRERGVIRKGAVGTVVPADIRLALKRFPASAGPAGEPVTVDTSQTNAPRTDDVTDRTSVFSGKMPGEQAGIAAMDRILK